LSANLCMVILTLPLGLPLPLFSICPPWMDSFLPFQRIGGYTNIYQPNLPPPPHTSPMVYPHVFLYSTGHTYSIGFTLMVICTALSIYPVTPNENRSHLHLVVWKRQMHLFRVTWSECELFAFTLLLVFTLP
jgi:hypothetical protein